MERSGNRKNGRSDDTSRQPEVPTRAGRAASTKPDARGGISPSGQEAVDRQRLSAGRADDMETAATHEELELDQQGARDAVHQRDRSGT